jgi:hypothetical protein
MRAFEVISDADAEGLARLRRSAEGRVVPLPSVFSPTDADVTLLALGFAGAEVGALAVSYARTGGRVKATSRANIASSFVSDCCFHSDILRWRVAYGGW